MTTNSQALLVCTYLQNEGFPDNPDGWLKPTAEVTRKSGGLLICDEVQSELGRAVTHFWANEKMGIVPDVMVNGKPMAIDTLDDVHPIPEQFHDHSCWACAEALVYG
jgi:4-aminobutyrate aminotransferase-like enzyme